MWDNILGNARHKKFLEHYLQNDSRPHALLFVGNEGLGKYMLAKAFAESLLCHNLKGHDGCQSCKQFEIGTHPDFIEVGLLEDKKTILIEQVRELIASSAFAPVLGKNKVVLIDGLDLMEKPAANAILKFLEEPPASWTIIMTATKEEKLLPTILSRVITLRFKPLSKQEIVKVFLEQIDDKEHADIYAGLSDGSIGMAVYLFEHDALDIRKHALKLLMALPTKFPMNLAVAAVNELTGTEKTLNRDKAVLWLRLLQLLLRDVLMLQTANCELYNNDLQFELNKLAVNFCQAGIKKCLSDIESANGDLLGNIGGRQVLEVLIMKMNGNLERR